MNEKVANSAFYWCKILCLKFGCVNFLTNIMPAYYAVFFNIVQNALANPLCPPSHKTHKKRFAKMWGGEGDILKMAMYCPQGSGRSVSSY